jgi:hypothetical protein
MQNLERYHLRAEDALMVFEFYSEGPKGQVTKIVQYASTNLKNFYNLGFGDKNPISGKIDDTIITDNGDSLKVLATVAATVYAFTESYPDALVYATGSNNARTRLYRIGISINLEAIQDDFDVFGLLDDRWEIFSKNTDYQAFLIKRKNLQL